MGIKTHKNKRLWRNKEIYGRSRKKNMEQQNQVSLTRLAKGAIEERIDLEVSKIIDNIQDPNTRADKKRTLTITIDFIPNAERNHVTLNTVVKSKLESTNSIQTALAVGFDKVTGEQMAVELVPNIPGQIDMNGNEQEPPKVLKLAR